MLDCPFTRFFAWVGRSGIFQFLYFFYQMSKNSKLHKHFMKDLVVHISLQALFLRLYFGKFLQKQLPRVISYCFHRVFSPFNKRAIPYMGVTGNSALCCSMECIKPHARLSNVTISQGTSLTIHWTTEGAVASNALIWYRSFIEWMKNMVNEMTLEIVFEEFCQNKDAKRYIRWNTLLV